MKTIGRLCAGGVVGLARFLVWLYYATIRVSGRDRIPASGPVLFVANHANSLFDPVILGLTVNRRVRYLAKGPLFEMPLVGKLLEGCGMIPVFRSQDDRAQVKRWACAIRRASPRMGRKSGAGGQTVM